MLKNISPAILGFALICFILPWAEISCQGHKVATVNGFQLATGTTIEGQKVKGEALAVFTLLSAIVGLALCFIKDKGRTLGVIVSSGVGIATILLLKLKLDGDILREGRGIIQLSYGAGYYLILISFLSTIGINVYYGCEGKWKPLFQGTKVKPGYKFCTECGSKNETENRFCSKCGDKFD